MTKVAINLGFISITWYSIFILIGVILATLLINKEAKKYNISSTFINNLIFWCVIFGIIGARIYYVLFNLDYYSASPIEAIKIWNGGLAIHGGLIVGALALIYQCKKYKISILKITDIALPCVLLAQSIGRWGNFFNMEAHGSIVSKAFLENLHLPEFIINGMHIGRYYYHPTFLYESILCIIGFFVLMIFRNLKNTKVGNTSALYLIWYGIIRLLIELLRTDSLMLGNLKMACLVSIIMIIGGIVMFIITRIKCENYNEGKINKK